MVDTDISKYFRECASIEKSDLWNFFLFCLFSTKIRVHLFKDWAVPKHADRSISCDVFCQSKANL